MTTRLARMWLNPVKAFPRFLHKKKRTFETQPMFCGVEHNILVVLSDIKKVQVLSTCAAKKNLILKQKWTIFKVQCKRFVTVSRS